jgi:hypothetical protein
MWVLPKPLCLEPEQVPLDAFRKSILWKGKEASEKTWENCIKNKVLAFLDTNCTTDTPEILSSSTSSLLLHKQRQVKQFRIAPESIFIKWVKGIRQDYNSTRKPKKQKAILKKTWPTPKALEVNESVGQWEKRRRKPSAKMMGPSLTVATKIEYKTWGTPAVFDSHKLERKDLDALLRHIQIGGRKRRTTTGNLSEQIESKEVEFVYEKVKEYHLQNNSMELREFVIRALREKGYSNFFTLPGTQLELWSTPTFGEEKRSKPRQDQSFSYPISVQTENVVKQFKGQLNPRWVEYLMGLPMGWTNAQVVKTYQFHNEKKKMNEPFVDQWPTPTSSQRGTDLTNYLLKNIRYIKAGKSSFGPSLGQAIEAEHYYIKISELFRTIDLSLDQTTLKQSIRKEYMGL